MKIPIKTTGRHKIRDTKICMLWARELVSSEEISAKFKLSIRRIQQIVYANRDFLKLENEWEKSKQARWLKQQMKKKGDTKRDSLDIQDRLLNIIKDDKVLVDNSKHYHFTIDKLQSARKRALSGINERE